MINGPINHRRGPCRYGKVQGVESGRLWLGSQQ